MKHEPEKHAAATWTYHGPAVNTAAIATVAADSEHIHVLDCIHGSFSATPNGGEKLNVTINAVEVWAVDIVAAGPFAFYFPGGLYGSARNQALVVTLAADDGGAAGKVNIRTR